MLLFTLNFSCFAGGDSNISKEATSCLNLSLNNKQHRSREWLSQHFKDGTVVVLAEHHEQVSQLQSLSSAVKLLAQNNSRLYFAAEWLPISAQTKINNLVQSSIWSEELWWSIVGEKYYIRPLHIKEYELPMKAIWELNKDRSMPIELIALSPDCRFLKHKTQGVTECLMSREQRMEEVFRAGFTPESKGIVLMSLGFRHAQLSTTDLEGHIPLAQRLDKDYEVFSIVLNGLGENGRSMCAGLFDQLQGDWIVPLSDPSLKGLSTKCLSTDPYHKELLLSQAFSHIWTNTHDWQLPTLLTEHELKTLDSSVLNGWSRFQSVFMKASNIGSDPLSWEMWMHRNFKPVSPVQENVFECDKLDDFKLNSMP